MKRIVFIFSAIAILTVAIFALQNRFVFALPFLHQGMPKTRVETLLLGDFREGFAIAGQTGTVPSQQLYCDMHFLKFKIGECRIHLWGNKFKRTEWRWT